MEDLARCNLCGATRRSLFAEKEGHKTKRLFRIVTCDECGLMFVSPRLTAEENHALYDEAYFNGDGFDGTVNYVLLDAEAATRNGENAGVLAKIALEKPGRGIRVLDVGCGTGCLLRALLAAGYTDVWGLELSEYAAGIAAKDARATVRVGDLLETDLPKGSFDVINATEVIEHLRDPMASFRRIKELLAPGGVFLYSTGNARGLYARILGKHWPYLHPEGHLFYYNPETLARYFREVGLVAVPWTSLGRKERREYLRAEDQMSRSVLRYVGASGGSRAGVFRTLGAIDSSFVLRAVTRVVGKHALPMARNPSRPTP